MPRASLVVPGQSYLELTAEETLFSEPWRFKGFGPDDLHKLTLPLGLRVGR